MLLEAQKLMLYAADKGKAAGRRVCLLSQVSQAQQISQDIGRIHVPCQFAGPNSGKPFQKRTADGNQKSKGRDEQY